MKVFKDAAIAGENSGVAKVAGLRILGKEIERGRTNVLLIMLGALAEESEKKKKGDGRRRTRAAGRNRCV